MKKCKLCKKKIDGWPWYETPVHYLFECGWVWFLIAVAVLGYKVVSWAITGAWF